MSQFRPEDALGSQNVISNQDVVLASDRDQTGAGDIVFTTGGVERARIKYNGTGSGWTNFVGAAFVYNVKDAAYGAKGDGVTDDTAAIQAAITAAGLVGGIVWFPPGTYKVTATLSLLSKVVLVGSGTGLVGSAGAERGTTTIISSYNGKVIDCGTNSDWRIEALTINGDRTQATQDLVSVSTLGNGLMRHVQMINAGRDAIVLDGALNNHFDSVYVASSKRYGLNLVNATNANTFTKCRFRTADGWGINAAGGQDNTFVGCTIEDNNGVTLTQGGINVTAGQVALFCCHIEGNGHSGNPAVVAGGQLDDFGSFWVETTSISHTSGKLRMFGSVVSNDPFLVSTATVADEDPVLIGVIPNGNLNITFTRNGQSRTLWSGGAWVSRLGSSERPLATTDFVLSAGWGTGATVTSVTGTDSAFRVKVTAGTAPAANPFLELTWKKTWTVAPVVTATMTSGGTGVATPVAQVGVATSLLDVYYNGTPVNGSTYEFNVTARGL